MSCPKVHYISAAVVISYGTNTVSPVAKLRESNANVGKYLLNRISIDSVEWLCKTCHSYLVKERVPPCSAVNGMQFTTKPQFFDLNELECRLLAPRLAFLKLMQATRRRQLKINGNLVNVPADVTNTVSMLPRLSDQSGTIKVNLKRKLQYKSSALSLNVRPHKVIQTANWLVNNSTLYREEGITFNPEWVLNNDADAPTDECSAEQNNDQSQDVNYDSNRKETVDDDKDDWSEDEAETPAGVTDTMLTATDFLEDSERQHILNVAPGEGSRPLSVFRDKYSEVAYPGIFLGQKRPENDKRFVPVHYSEICKSELRKSDRRAAICVENIFFKTKKLQMKILLGKSQVALRKCQGSNRTMKAGQLKQQGALDRLIHYDEGFKFLRALRGSPHILKRPRKIFLQ